MSAALSGSRWSRPAYCLVDAPFSPRSRSWCGSLGHAGQSKNASRPQRTNAAWTSTKSAAVEQQTRGKFTIGDRALEIEPVKPRGGTQDTEWTVRESLVRLAEDIGLTFNTVENATGIASRWPKGHRQADVSFTIPRILGRIENDQERWAAIKNPSEGKARWTAADAKRRVGWTVDSPEAQQKRFTTWPRTRGSPRR